MIDKEYVKKEWKNGRSQKSIAKEMGVSHQRIQHIVNPPPKIKRKEANPYTTEKFIVPIYFRISAQMDRVLRREIERTEWGKSQIIRKALNQYFKREIPLEYRLKEVDEDYE